MNEELKKLLGDDLVKSVDEKLGDKRIDLIENNYVPMSRFNEVNEKNKTLQTQLDTQKTEFENQLNTVNTQLTELQKNSKLNDTEKQKIVDLTNSNEKMKADHAKQLQEQNKNHKIDLKLIDVGAKNIPAVRANLQMDKISLDGDNIIGLDDQIETLKKDHDYLFGEIKKSGKPPKAGDDPPSLNEIEKSFAEVKAEYDKNPNSQLGAQLIALQRKMRQDSKT